MGYLPILYDQPRDITKWYESLVAGHVQLGSLKQNPYIHIVKRIPETVTFDLIRNWDSDRNKILCEYFPDCVWVRDTLSNKEVTPIYASDNDCRFLQSGKRGSYCRVFVGFVFLNESDAAIFKLTWPELLSDWKTLG